MIKYKETKKEIISKEYNYYCDSCGKLIYSYKDKDPRDDYNMDINTKTCSMTVVDNFSLIAGPAGEPKPDELVIRRNFCCKECYTAFHDSLIEALRNIGFRTNKELREEELRRTL